MMTTINDLGKLVKKRNAFEIARIKRKRIKLRGEPSSFIGNRLPRQAKLISFLKTKVATQVILARLSMRLLIGNHSAFLAASGALSPVIFNAIVLPH